MKKGWYDDIQYRLGNERVCRCLRGWISIEEQIHSSNRGCDDRKEYCNEGSSSFELVQERFSVLKQENYTVFRAVMFELVTNSRGFRKETLQESTFLKEIPRKTDDAKSAVPIIPTPLWSKIDPY